MHMLRILVCDHAGEGLSEEPLHKTVNVAMNRATSEAQSDMNIQTKKFVMCDDLIASKHLDGDVYDVHGASGLHGISLHLCFYSHFTCIPHIGKVCRSVQRGKCVQSIH